MSAAEHESQEGSRYTAALRAISPRAAQVIALALLERRAVAECAAFYGISEPSFLSLLGRSVAELATELGLLAAATDAGGVGAPERLRGCLRRLEQASEGDPPTAGDRHELERLMRALWRAGPSLLPAPLEAEAADRWWDTLLRLALVAAAIGAVLYFSRAS